MNRVPIACLHYQIMTNFYEGSLAFIIISIHGLSGQDSTIFHPMKVYTVALFARSLQLATTTVYIVYIPFVQNTYTQRYDYVLQLLSKREYRIFLIMLEGLRGGGI